MQPDYVGKPKDLYLLYLIRKTCLKYVCPMRYCCGCDTIIRITSIWITETKQTFTLETIRVHALHSQTAGKKHACKSSPGVCGFSRPESEGSAKDEPGWWSYISFSVSSF